MGWCFPRFLRAMQVKDPYTGLLAPCLSVALWVLVYIPRHMDSLTSHHRLASCGFFA